jgi:hypothetical protein
VLDEIDKHKKANGRTRDRAIDIFGRVRAMLQASQTEVVLRESGPRVLLRRLGHVQPNADFKEDLDYSRTDERLVGIASTLALGASDHRVVLFTDDSGPASTADSFGVEYLMIPPTWRRPAAQTDEQKRIRELEQDLSTYRAQEPSIVIGTAEGADGQNALVVKRRVATPLTARKLDELVSMLEKRLPPRTDFAPPCPSVRKVPGATVTTVYSAPDDADIQAYRDVGYPDWLSRCRNALATNYEEQGRNEPAMIVQVPMRNEGTRPAAQVRVDFEAQGPVKLLRILNDDDDGVDEEPNEPAAPRLPSPPAPPAFKTVETREEVLGHTEGIVLRRSGVDIATLARGFPDYGSAFREMNRASDMLRSLSGGSCASLLGADPVLAQPIRPSFEHLIGRPHIPEPRDPEGFYYDWPAREVVRKGSLNCELWRHRGGEEAFEFEVLFDGDGAVAGSVVCAVHAQNLIHPVQSRIPVRREIEAIDVEELARKMVQDGK